MPGKESPGMACPEVLLLLLYCAGTHWAKKMDRENEFLEKVRVTEVQLKQKCPP